MLRRGLTALLPEGVDERALVALGHRWLHGRDDRSEWNYVWQALLERTALLPDGVDERALVALGLQWLHGRDDRDEWNYVWRALLDRTALLPDGVDSETLFQKAIAWLDGRDRQKEWSHVWERLFGHYSHHRPRLIEIAMDHLTRVRGAPHWPIVWSKIVRARVASAEQIETLKPLGERWALDPRNRSSRSLSWVLEGLLELGAPSKAALALTWTWVATADHPSWPPIAAKLIAADPHGSAVLKTLDTLAVRAAGWSHAKRLGETLSPLVSRDDVPSDVRDAVTRFIARVTPTHAKKLKRAEIQSFGPHVVPGLIADGAISGIVQYGVFVDCGDFHGLLHRNALSIGVTPESFKMGQTVRVEVIKRDDKGVGLRLIAPSES